MLDRLVQRTECDIAVVEGGQSFYFRHLESRMTTPSAVCQAHERFGRILLAHTRRLGQAVAEPVIHRGHAGGVGVVEVRQLNPGGLSGKHRQAVPAHMPGQVHEDVDPVVADQLGQRRVGEI